MTETERARQSAEGDYNAISDRGGTSIVNVYNGAPAAAFRWRPPWDFAPFLESKRHGFVGRDWLFEEVGAWLVSGTGQALLIQADYGVGKSAFVAELIARNPRSAIVVHHCCQHDTHDTLDPAEFVWNVAAQLRQAFPAYAAQVESEPALQQALDRANEDAASAFERVVLGPLGKLKAPIDGAKCLVIDALDESLEFADTQGRQKAKNIVELLAARTRRLPKWLRVLATTRPLQKVTAPISGAFATTIIDAEGQDNIEDLRKYVRGRASVQIIDSKLMATSVPAKSLAKVIEDKSGGKFLYAELAFDALEGGILSVGDMLNLPPGMDRFFFDAFERRFAHVERNYALTGKVLGLLAASQEPLSRMDLAGVLSRSEDELQTSLSVVSDFLTNRNKHYTFSHLSLAEWLTGEDVQGEPRAGVYHVSTDTAHQQLTAWSQREAKHGLAHERDYLVRHMAAHLPASVRAPCYAQLLTDVRWLQRKLVLTDVNALLNEFRYAPHDETAAAIEFALRQSAHILRRQDAVVDGPRQLSSQLLARLQHRTEPPIRAFCDSLIVHARTFGEPWLRPLAASLRAPEALLGTINDPAGANSLAVLSDGRLASGGGDTIRLWNLVNAQLDATLEGHTNVVDALAALPDGRLASGSWDNSIKLWSTAGVLEATLEGHTGWITCLAVLPNGWLASGSWDHTIKLWNVATAQLVATLEDHEDAVGALAVLPNGRLVSGSSDGTIKLWNPASGQLEATLDERISYIRALAVLCDGTLAIAAENHIMLWDPASLQLKTTLEGHSGNIRVLAVLPDGRLASSANDRTIQLWDPTRALLEVTLEGHSAEVDALAVLPDGRLASVGGGTIKLWNPVNVKPETRLERHSWRVDALAVLSDGRVASGSWDGTIKLWNPGSGVLEATLRGHTSWVEALAALPDGRLASGGSDRTIRLWNPGSAQLEVTLGHSGRVEALAMLPDGRLASGLSNGAITLWNLSNAQSDVTLEGHLDHVLALAVLPDGRLVSGSGDHTIKLWNPTSGQLEATLEGHNSSVNALAVLPGDRLASGSEDRTIKLWDMASAQLEATLQGHVHYVTALAALPNSKLVSVSEDCTVAFWSTTPTAAIDPITFVADAPIRCVAVTADRKTIIAGDGAGCVHFLRIEET